MLRSTHSHHDRRIKFQKCQISKPVTAASKTTADDPQTPPESGPEYTLKELQRQPFP